MQAAQVKNTNTTPEPDLLEALMGTGSRVQDSVFLVKFPKKVSLGKSFSEKVGRGRKQQGVLWVAVWSCLPQLIGG